MEITICGIVYEIIIEETRWFEAWGHIDHSACKIHLDGKANQQCRDESFIHEIIHGILVHTGDIGKHDEPLIRRIANGLYQSGITMDSFDIGETPPEAPHD